MIACFPLKQSLISHVEQLQENKIQIPDSILIAMNKKKKLSCAKKQVKHYLWHFKGVSISNDILIDL